MIIETDGANYNADDVKNGNVGLESGRFTSNVKAGTKTIDCNIH